MKFPIKDKLNFFQFWRVSDREELGWGLLTGVDGEVDLDGYIFTENL